MRQRLRQLGRAVAEPVSARAARAPEPVWRERLRTLGTALGVARPDDRSALLERLSSAGDAEVWLALAVLSARLPTSEDVLRTRRALQLDGPGVVLTTAQLMSTTASRTRRVRVVVDETVVDLGDLARYPLGTGIQRVARSITREWWDRHPLRAVAWTDDYDALVALPASDVERILSGSGAVDVDPDEVLVPWRGTYLLPELAVQPRRCAALAGLAERSPSRCGVIGFDCVPISSSETSVAGLPAAFALNLAAVARFDAVAAISQAAAAEYRGWTQMLAGAGLDGPEVASVLLPAVAPEPTDASLAVARQRFLVADLPMVLCIGSHEPRKNHLAVLQAAELLWRRGHQFSLSFVGGNAWSSEEFFDRLAGLQREGRPVESVSRLSDDLLWAAYRLARCTVFPSLNEGFGLPVAESLAAGTPALTSSFGSMREIADAGGAVVVDPRDDRAIADALERLIVDDAHHARLVDASRRRPAASWARYADEVWGVLHATDPTSAAA